MRYTVSPSDEGCWQVGECLRKTRSGGLAVETMNENDLRVLKECKNFDDLGLKVESQVGDI